MSELKPCPFCSGKAELLVFCNHGETHIFYEFFVECHECCGRGGGGDAPHNSDTRDAIREAMDSWNNRAGDKNE